MARKNGLSINDPNTLAIIRKYLAGGKLTTTEKATIAGLVRMYPSLFTSGQASLLAASRQDGGVNVNISSMQRDPRSARSQYNQNRAAATRRGGGAGVVTSPGGFKSSGRDAESQMRRSGQMTTNAVVNNLREEENGNWTLGNRKYNRRQRDYILQRGLSGATMNWADQAVYDKMIRDQQAEKERAARAAQEKLLRNQRIAALGQDPRTFDVDDQTLVRLEEMKRKKDEAAQFALKQEREDASDALKRRRDLADWKEKEAYKRPFSDMAERRKRADESVKAGTHEYTREQLDKMTKMRNEVDMILEADDMTDDEKNEAVAKLQDMIDRVRLNPHEKITPDETLEDKYKKTYVNERGVRMALDDKGKWYVVDNPKDYEREKQSFQREEARRTAEQNRRDKWLDSRIEYYMKPRKAEGKLGEETVPGLSYEEAYARARTDEKVRFAEENNAADEAEKPMTPEMLNEARALLAETDAELGAEQQPQPAAPEPAPNEGAPTASGISFHDFFARNAPAPADVPPVEQPDVALCPACGAQLDADGRCEECGYPNNNTED